MSKPLYPIHKLILLLKFLDGKKRHDDNKLVTKSELKAKLYTTSAFDRWINKTLLSHRLIRQFTIVRNGRKVTVYTKTLRGERLLEILENEAILESLCFTRGKRLTLSCPWVQK